MPSLTILKVTLKSPLTEKGTLVLSHNTDKLAEAEIAQDAKTVELKKSVDLPEACENV